MQNFDSEIAFMIGSYEDILYNFHVQGTRETFYYKIIFYRIMFWKQLLVLMFYFQTIGLDGDFCFLEFK